MTVAWERRRPACRLKEANGLLQLGNNGPAEGIVSRQYLCYEPGLAQIEDLRFKHRASSAQS
jgi:hypothetical protein